MAKQKPAARKPADNLTVEERQMCIAELSKWLVEMGDCENLTEAQAEQRLKILRQRIHTLKTKLGAGGLQPS